MYTNGSRLEVGGRPPKFYWLPLTPPGPVAVELVLPVTPRRPRTRKSNGYHNDRRRQLYNFGLSTYYDK